MLKMKGLTKNEEIFYRKLKKQYLDDIDFATRNNKDVQALRDILCMIDSLAGLFTGREDSGVEESWFSFIDRVMKDSKNLNITNLELHFPNLKIYSYSRTERINRRKKNQIENCCALLYSIFRTGVVHDGILPDTFYLTRTSTELWEIEEDDGEYSIGLNVLKLKDALEDAISRFEQSFDNDQERARRFKERYRFLQDRYIVKKT